VTADHRSAARFLSAVAEGTRLRVVRHLAAGPARVTAVAEALGVTLWAVSHHLRAMKAVGVLASERDGRFIRYRLVGATVTGGKLVLTRPGVKLKMDLGKPARKKREK
jgi:DNA-binding transcriptional ArsR family regulator